MAVGGVHGAARSTVTAVGAQSGGARSAGCTVSSEHKQGSVCFGNVGRRLRRAGEADTFLRRLTPQAINTHSGRDRMESLPKVTQRAGPGVTEAGLRGPPRPDAGPGQSAAQRGPARTLSRVSAPESDIGTGRRHVEVAGEMEEDGCPARGGGRPRGGHRGCGHTGRGWGSRPPGCETQGPAQLGHRECSAPSRRKAGSRWLRTGVPGCLMASAGVALDRDCEVTPGRSRLRTPDPGPAPGRRPGPCLGCCHSRPGNIHRAGPCLCGRPQEWWPGSLLREKQLAIT